jgi:hypothetical protein
LTHAENGVEPIVQTRVVIERDCSGCAERCYTKNDRMICDHSSSFVGCEEQSLAFEVGGLLLKSGMEEKTEKKDKKVKKKK